MNQGFDVSQGGRAPTLQEVHEDFETGNVAVELLVKIATALEADPDLPRYQMRDILVQ